MLERMKFNIYVRIQKFKKIVSIFISSKEIYTTMLFDSGKHVRSKIILTGSADSCENVNIESGS